MRHRRDLEGEAPVTAQHGLQVGIDSRRDQHMMARIPVAGLARTRTCGAERGFAAESARRMRYAPTEATRGDQSRPSQPPSGRPM